MNAKTLLLAHGEKALVLVTAGLCGLGVYSTLTDDSVRPAGITSAALREKGEGIEKVMKEAAAPQLLPVPGYLANMQRRFDAEFATGSHMAWLSAMPDRGPGEGTILYIYELPAPTITARDVAGVVELTVSPARSIRPSGRRVADGLEAQWTSPTGDQNAAKLIGFVIETRIQGQEWKPLKSKALNGNFLAAEANGTAAVKLEGLEPWATHEFRAASIGRASGYPLSANPAGGAAGAVLVVAGRIIEGQDIENLQWEPWLQGLQRGEASVLKRFRAPTQIDLPAELKSNPLEQTYTGDFSDQLANVQVTSDVRFALDQVSEQDGQLIAKVLVTRQFKNANAPAVWLKDPVPFKVAIGEIIGKTVDVPNPRVEGRKINVDLSTPFELKDVKRGVKRILFYEIRETARTEGEKKGKDLAVVAKEAQTDVAILRNTKTGLTTELVKLSTIRRPTKPGAIFDPWVANDVQEETEFKKDPATFRMAILEPTPPKPWGPDEGPLGKLRSEQDEVDQLTFTTDTTYFELADGRLVWWEPLNKRIQVYPEQAVPAPTDAALPPTGTAPAVPPKGTQPKLPPPGTMPPGAMPPGMMPPGMLPPPGAK
jgi:hypothetical protein